MRRLVTLVTLVLVTTIGSAGPVDAQAEAGGATESILVAGTAAQYRNALTTLSTVTTGTNTLRLSADITLTTDVEPTYTGTQPLTINGLGHVLDGSDLNRALDSSGTPAAVSIRNLRVVDGDAGGGGGGAVNTGGALTVRDSAFESNEGAEGGALRNVGSLLIERSSFDENIAGSGGAAFAYAGDITVTDSTFDDNRADAAGALRAEIYFNGGEITVLRSTFTDNEAESNFAGAVYGTSIDLTDSLFEGNVAEQDGGAVQGVAITATNTTFFANEAATGAAIATIGVPHSVDLEHVTMVDNVGDAQVSTLYDPVILTARASLLSSTGTPACANTGSTTSEGHNVEAADTCGFDAATDIVDSPQPTGILLGTRRDNGGPTATMYPLAGSVLVDAIPVGECTQTADQRAVARPFGSGCDIGAVEQVFPAHGFTDVPAWVEDTVRWIASPINQPQIMTGITPTTFEPDDPITRAQVVRLLYNEEGAPDVSAYGPHPFTDVPAWVADAVTWAYGEGLVTGITPTTFEPNDPITRAQVTRMKYRFADSPDTSGIDPHPFTDVPAWVADAVTWAADPDNPLPLVTGITPTTFEPNEPITRAQVARMDHRMALTPAAWTDAGDAPPAMLFQRGLF